MVFGWPALMEPSMVKFWPLENVKEAPLMSADEDAKVTTTVEIGTLSFRGASSSTHAFKAGEGVQVVVVFPSATLSASDCFEDALKVTKSVKATLYDVGTGELLVFMELVLEGLVVLTCDVIELVTFDELVKVLLRRSANSMIQCQTHEEDFDELVEVLAELVHVDDVTRLELEELDDEDRLDDV
jgi:hypothetical protein